MVKRKRVDGFANRSCKLKFANFRRNGLKRVFLPAPPNFKKISSLSFSKLLCYLWFWKIIKQYREIGDERWDDGGAARLCMVVWAGAVRRRRWRRSETMAARQSNSGKTSFKISGVGWDSSEHVFWTVFLFQEWIMELSVP